MNTIHFFQSRPLGTNTGNYSLARPDAALFLASHIYLEEMQQEKAKTESFDEEAKILETSSFSNGVLVKAMVTDWVLTSILTKSPELKTLTVNDTPYIRPHNNAKWTPAHVEAA